MVNNEQGVITFREKNQKRPKRNLSEILLRKIKYLISINKLRENDFLFFSNHKNNSDDQRSNYISLKLNRIIKESSCFTKEEGEIICSHMFRSTHAIETFQQNGLIKSAQELGHSKISITMNNYLKPEENNLYLNEEKLRFNNPNYQGIFDYLPDNNSQFTKKKRNNSVVKSANKYNKK